MITSWIVYAMVCAALFSAAAAAADQAARMLRQPRRWAWFLALASSLAWPAFAMLRASMTPSRLGIAPAVLDVQRVTSAASTAAVGASRVMTLDRAILALWISVSAVLLLRLALTMWSIQRRRAGWHRASLDGVDVRLTNTGGPAVVGLRTMDVIVPTWLRSLDAPLRAMVLTHESEHRAARDPLLLFVSGLAMALTPWNLAMWWQARRLRLAIEMDCDARVLRRHGDSERYALLLLTIAQRQGVSNLSFATMLSEPPSQLERRIDAMQSPRPERPGVRAALAIALAASALAAACAIASPDRVTAPRADVQPQRTASNGPYFEFQVEKAVRTVKGTGAPRYPDILRSANQEGGVLAQFVVRPDSSVDTTTIKILKTTHELFANSVRAWLPTARFAPALVGGKAVSQIVQMPFQFNLAQNVVLKPTVPPTVAEVRTIRGVPEHSVYDSDQHVTYSAIPRRDPTGKPYFEFQIEKPAEALKSSGAPKYPAALRQRNVQGEVLGQFIVTESGHADVSSFKALHSTDPLFTASVRDWLASAQFTPAQVEGKKVKQLMQMPFQFNLAP